MRIAIQTLGTRGDVQPYVALALGLKNSGHEVQIAAPIQFENFVRQYNISFAPLPGEFLDLMNTSEGKKAIAGGQGFSAGFKLLKYVRPLMLHLLDKEWAAVQSFEPDILVYHPKSIGTPHMAERLRIPAILASPLPGFTPTSDFPSPILPFPSLGPFNRMSHALAIHGGTFLFSNIIQEWRTNTLGMTTRKNITTRTTGTLYAYSPQVVPVPADWTRDVLVSGYWFLDNPKWKPDETLSNFLAAGKPPIYVGFGSMPGLDPERMTSLFADALLKTNNRGLLATGGGALKAGPLSRNIYVIDNAPHDQLFPLVSATIHHGGAGTTAASLRAGIPTTICPFFGDQPFWGRRIEKLGAGPKSLNRKNLSVETIAKAITAMEAPSMRERATNLGAEIRKEQGIAAASAFIERYASSKTHNFR